MESLRVQQLLCPRAHIGNHATKRGASPVSFRRSVRGSEVKVRRRRPRSTGTQMDICVKRIADGRALQPAQGGTGRVLPNGAQPAGVHRRFAAGPTFRAGRCSSPAEWESRRSSATCGLSRVRAAPKTRCCCTSTTTPPRLSRARDLQTGRGRRDHGSRVRRHRPTAELIEDLVDDADEKRETFVCAPEGLVDAVRGYLVDLGQAPERFIPSPSRPSSGPPVDDGSRYTVTFSRTHRSVEIDGATTLRGSKPGWVSGAHRCRSGLCRACVTHKFSGTTDREAGGRQRIGITAYDSLACSDIELDLQRRQEESIPDAVEMATAERTDPADLLATPTSDQWEAQSLCERWRCATWSPA